MAIKLGDIARALGHLGTVTKKVGEKTGLNEFASWWTKQGVDHLAAKSYVSPFPMDRIYDKGLDEFLEAEAKHDRKYILVPIHIETPVGGSKMTDTKYKRLISFEVWKAIKDEHGKRIPMKDLPEVVSAVYITDRYKGTRGNQSYSAVALIPKAPAAPAYKAAYPGMTIRAPHSP